MLPRAHHPPALLALADGTVFYGEAIGALGCAVGEVVFNTAMTGYQEILTDPSYYRQLVTLTYPHVGNVGVNRQDEESDRIQAAGLIVRDLPLLASSWRKTDTLDDYLRAQQCVGIAGIDTRALTRRIREYGAQAACIACDGTSPEQAVQRARGFGSMQGLDLARVVSCQRSYRWPPLPEENPFPKANPPSEISPLAEEGGEWRWMRAGTPDQSSGFAPVPSTRFHVLAYDFGVKRNILRMLAARGCALTVLPAQTPAEEALALKPDGIFLSNGPGDPEPCTYAIDAIRVFLERRIPTFGICLGHQLLGLAVGARTSKMKVGHHGANHPVREIDSDRVFITSQNHGFQVDEAGLPREARVTHRSLFDDTVQGIALLDRPAFGFQGHPEASPGPQDIGPLFDRFTQLMAGALSRR